MHDVAIINGLVVSNGARLPRDVAIEGGVIVAVEEHGRLSTACTVIDAAGKWLLPGAIDIHFHCRAPSHPERADFTSESRAAIAGGVTTIFEMPISDPACSTPEVLRARRALAEGRCYGGGLLAPLVAEALVAHGAIGFKVFTTTPPIDRLSEFNGLCAVAEDAIYAALAAIAPTGHTCVFHAENQALIDFFARSQEHDVPARPPIIEATAIAIIGAVAREVGARVHIAHLTSAAGLRALRGAQAAGTEITAETCPHYLLFDSSAIDRWGAFVKIAPPLREARDVAALWDGVREGLITVIASDHAPFRPAEKEVTYAAAPHGMPSVETMLPILLDAALRHLLPLEHVVDLVTTAPARLFGLDGRKGTVREGADADLVIFDPEALTEIHQDRLFTKAAGCAVAYEGMRLCGRIEQTIVAGQVSFRDGYILGEPRGRFVRPDPLAMAVTRAASPR
jgi:dihydroorotase (multifunctional complex type)